MQEVDPRSDIYSLGVVAYQMLTGKLPFNATDPLEWAALHMGVAPAPVDSHGVVVPFEMRCAIHRALAKETSQRPQSMREFFSEFTIGTGTLAPGRASSMLPAPGSMMPFPPPPRAPSMAQGSQHPSEAPRPSVLAQSVPPAPGTAPRRQPATVDDKAFFVNEGTVDEDGEPRTKVKSDAIEAPTRVQPEGASAPPGNTPSDLRSEVSTRAQSTFVLEDQTTPPLPGADPRFYAPGVEPATIRDPHSQPEISFHEMSRSELSLPPGQSSLPHDAALKQTAPNLNKSQKGTIVMAASEPPPKARLTMPDLLPPTIRDARELANVGKPARGRLLAIALVLIAVGAIASGLGWFFFMRGGASGKAKTKPSATAVVNTAAAATTDTTAPPQTAPPPNVSATTPPPQPQPSASTAEEKPDAKEKLSPCQTVIFSAVSGKCDLAKRAYARCPEDSPYRASATRATALCP